MYSSRIGLGDVETKWWVNIRSVVDCPVMAHNMTNTFRYPILMTGSRYNQPSLKGLTTRTTITIGTDNKSRQMKCWYCASLPQVVLRAMKESHSWAYGKDGEQGKKGNPAMSNMDVRSRRQKRSKNRSNNRDKLDKKLEPKHLMCTMFSIKVNRGKLLGK